MVLNFGRQNFNIVEPFYYGYHFIKRGVLVSVVLKRAVLLYKQDGVVSMQTVVAKLWLHSIRLCQYMSILQVRTLFVSGLPMDVRLRELYLLFRCYEVHAWYHWPLAVVGCSISLSLSLSLSLCMQGYEGSFLKLISSKPGKPPQVCLVIANQCWCACS